MKPPRHTPFPDCCRRPAGDPVHRPWRSLEDLFRAHDRDHENRRIAARVRERQKIDERRAARAEAKAARETAGRQALEGDAKLETAVRDVLADGGARGPALLLGALTHRWLQRRPAGSTYEEPPEAEQGIAAVLILTYLPPSKPRRWTFRSDFVLDDRGTRISVFVEEGGPFA